MRRSDREITDFATILSVIDRCDVCRLALNDGEYPYIVPLNFGMSLDGTDITLYFHSAPEGKKLDLLRSDDRVCFEMDCAHRLVSDEERGYCTMEYESVIGYGRVSFITDRAEKERALQYITDKYHDGGFAYSRAAVDATAVYKLSVLSLTGKARKKK